MNQNTKETLSSLGLLALRLGAGGFLIYGHGWGKLTHFSERAQRFADPLHVGAPASLAMAVFAEVFCAAAILVGLGTRVAAAVVTFLFLTILFVVERNKPVDDRELGFLYLACFATLLLTGAGRFSIDAWLGKRLGGKGRG